MNVKWWWWLPVIIAIGIALMFGVLLVNQLRDQADPSRDLGAPSALLNQSIPVFSASQLKRPSQRIDESLLKGQVAIINFWGTWCPECALEHDQLMALAEEVPVYGVNFNDKRAAAVQWLAENGDPFTATYFDPDGEVYIEWGVTGAPETFIIDAKGHVRYRHAGRLTEQLLQQTIRPLLQALEQEQEKLEVSIQKGAYYIAIQGDVL